MISLVNAKNLSAGYKDHLIWDDANFNINSGEFVGLLGSNGAGKTTLFKILLGLIQPSSGEITMFGGRPRKGSTRIGYVPQHRIIDTETKIDALEYVRLGLAGSQYGFSLPARAANERKLGLETLGLVDAKEFANRPLNELSGGELQRVFLAQALISQPDLLLLDEPLANLDLRRENQLIQLVSGIVRKQHISVLLIAHDINPILSEVDRIIYIANGKVASGTADKIVTSKTLSKLYDAPIEVVRDSKGRVAVFGVEAAVHHDD